MRPKPHNKHTKFGGSSGNNSNNSNDDDDDDDGPHQANVAKYLEAARRQRRRQRRRRRRRASSCGGATTAPSQTRDERSFCFIDLDVLRRRAISSFVSSAILCLSPTNWLGQNWRARALNSLGPQRRAFRRRLKIACSHFANWLDERPARARYARN